MRKDSFECKSFIAILDFILVGFEILNCFSSSKIVKITDLKCKSVKMEQISHLKIRTLLVKSLHLFGFLNIFNASAFVLM